ncbi:MAG: hypothetical protein B6I20_07090 [Bacteroidetes bacterium 4572_117]|nr:MAG: hypothetical protein B6I20_07090 [Bacteroidetes bacterium 4572_117]
MQTNIQLSPKKNFYFILFYTRALLVVFSCTGLVPCANDYAHFGASKNLLVNVIGKQKIELMCFAQYQGFGE